MKIGDIRNNGSFSFLWNKELEEELYLSDAYRHYLSDMLNDEKGLTDNIRFSLSHSIVICYGGILEALLHEYVFMYFKNLWDIVKIKKFCKIIEYKEIK